MVGAITPTPVHSTTTDGSSRSRRAFLYGESAGSEYSVGTISSGWRSLPVHADKLCTVLEVTDGAVATSARYERGDHIIDGRTGRPATGLLSMTVVASSLTEADSVATAAFAMGVEGIGWAASLPGCEVFAVDEGERVLRTAGFRLTDAASTV